MKRIHKFVFLLLSIFALGTGVLVLNANDIGPFISPDAGFEKADKNVSIIGYVQSIDDKSITIKQATASDKTNNDTYVVYTKHADKIETHTYNPMSLSAISIGDKIITQGVTDGSKYWAKRIIVFYDSASLSQQEDENIIDEQEIENTNEEIEAAKEEITEESETTSEEITEESIQEEQEPETTQAQNPEPTTPEQEEAPEKTQPETPEEETKTLDTPQTEITDEETQDTIETSIEETQSAQEPLSKEPNQQ
jgi:hypothetical protein